MNILSEKLMQPGIGTLAILGHVRPDGDCVGSCLALYNYVKAVRPQIGVQVYLETPAPKFSYLNGFDAISSETEDGSCYDLCICLDSGDRERLGAFSGYLDTAGDSLCVDHHITNRGYCHDNVVVPEASSTCEVLYGLMDEAQISRNVAECLYTGIIHDTGVLQYSNTSRKTMEIAGKLLETGIDGSRIVRESFYQKTYVQNQILGRALLESILFLDGRCIFSVIRQKDMAFYGVTGQDLDGIVDQLKLTAGVECAIFMHETDSHEYKISMRSNSDLDVSRVAAYFGGGGHVKAAGCTMRGSVHDVVNNLSEQIEKQLKTEDQENSCTTV